jgi:hypothetical protein
VLIAERILQRKIEFYNSPAMERGLIVEAEAVDWYEFDQSRCAPARCAGQEARGR